MVGLTGRTGTPVEAPQSANTSFETSLEQLLHTERLSTTVLYDGTGHEETHRHQIGYTGYPSYPIKRIETEGYLICFEGKLYDVPEESLADELQSIASVLFEDDRGTTEIRNSSVDGSLEIFREWLLDVDGSFLCAIFEKESGELVLFNDVLGRLPTYYYADSERILFSRELRYLLESVPPEFDRLGAAQCLLFGYSLGTRTLIDGVERLRPGTLIRIGADPLELEIIDAHIFSFDDPKHTTRSRSQNARELATRFVSACDRRAGSFETDLISLSGGLDSRSVLAGYHAAGRQIKAATMESTEYVPISDVELAEELADAFDVEWQSYDVGHPSGADLDTLIKTKNGQIGLMTSFVLTFLRQLEANHGGSMAYITGDGGDKALPDLTPSRSVDRADLSDYIIDENSILDIDQVSRITGVSTAAIRQSVREHVRTYPETSADGIYIHFLLYERAANFLFEGEDRNRLFFWSETPFYSLPFFRYAMNCPPEQKARYKLYRSFLEALSPTAANCTHALYGAPVSSYRHAAGALADDILSRYPSVLETLKPIIKSVNDLDTETTLDPATLECIREQIDRIDTLDAEFDTDELHQFLDTADDREKYAVYRIFALTSVVDDLTSTEQNEPSILERRSDTIFA
ncbi:asparagine synthase-related protein [Halobacteria archaeon AArc-curdl1]|uniref:Asparagine synthase-related protein n=1 Tax=Natronosalvus hydrolyticus TaxID=2979988 RepID=A0AAP3E913_9EURY|nr:asparagine synthase-related protein [Halobacteria archaeon AArc-curdl1]